MKVQGPNILPGEQQGGLSVRLSDFDHFTVLYDQITEHPVKARVRAKPQEERVGPHPGESLPRGKHGLKADALLPPPGEIKEQGLSQ